MMKLGILLSESDVTLQGIPSNVQEMMDGAENVVHDALFEPKSAGNPWDYLNGNVSGLEFGINAGQADSVFVAIFHLIQTGAISICVIALLFALIGVMKGNPQEMAESKRSFTDRVMLLFIISAAAGILSFFMAICNYVFGITT